MNLKKKIEKKGGQKKQIHLDEVKKKKKTWGSFVDWRSFKTNKRVILFYRELVSRSRNLNQRKSRSMNLLFLTIYYFNPIFKFQIRLFFTVKKEITNFLFPIYYLNPILSCWLINLGVFQIGKKTITNFLLPIYYFNPIYKWLVN